MTANLTEERLLKEEEKIKSAEKRIEQAENEILKSEKEILLAIKKEGITPLAVEPGLTGKEIGLVRSLLIGKLSRHKLISALLITTGSVLIWRGIWDGADQIPFLSYAGVSLIVGVLLIWFLKKYNDLH
jgi:hypothetical protein